MSDHTHEHGEPYANLHIEKKPLSEIEITGEIPLSVVEATRAKAIRNLTRNLELPGFRKGHVPSDMAIKHVGEVAIMQEVAELALSHSYGHIVKDNKLDVIGRPNITITKLAPGNPIGFKIETAVFPQVTLPDYEKIAANERTKHDDPEKASVTDEDIQNELTRIQKMLASVPKEGAKEGDTAKEHAAPEINDDFARMLGDFKNLDDLKAKMRIQLLADKKQKAADKRRLAIADAIITKATVEIPQIFIEGELDQMVADFKERVKRAGTELDAYLKQVKKTMEDLRREWRTDAEKRAKLQLVLAEIAKKENIQADEKKLALKVAHIKETYPDAEEQAIRAYTSAQMVNDKVFALLEGRVEAESVKKDAGEKGKTGDKA